MKPLLFLSDIDGTLMTHPHPLSDRVKQAVADFRAAGGLFSLITGRALCSTQEVIRDLQVDLPCILLTGALIYDPKTGANRFQVPCPQEILDKIQIIWQEEPDMSLQVFGPQGVDTLRVNDLVLRAGQPAERTHPVSCPQEITARPVLKLLLSCPDPQRLLERGQELFPLPQYRFAFSSIHFAEVVAPPAGKDTALVRLAQELQVPLDRVWVAGDAMTDLPMFRLAGRSFAPSTSPQLLQEQCHEVIPPATQGGLAQALEEATALLRQEAAQEKEA